MAVYSQFVTDDEILAALKQPRSIGWIGCKLGTTRERLEAVLAQHKIEILKSRIEEHKQTPTGIAYHLELLEKLSQIQTWHKQHYGDTK